MPDFQRLPGEIADRRSAVQVGRAAAAGEQGQEQVTEVEGNAGWYKVDMKVRPHFKYMGAFFTLSLVGKLDKE